MDKEKKSIQRPSPVFTNVTRSIKANRKHSPLNPFATNVSNVSEGASPTRSDTNNSYSTEEGNVLQSPKLSQSLPKNSFIPVALLKLSRAYEDDDLESFSSETPDNFSSNWNKRKSRDLDSEFPKSPLLTTSPSLSLFLNHTPPRRSIRNDTESDGSGTAFESNFTKPFINKSPFVKTISDVYESDLETDIPYKNSPNVYYKNHPLKYIYHLSTSLPETRTHGFACLGNEMKMNDNDGYQSDGDVAKLFSPSMFSELELKLKRIENSEESMTYFTCLEKSRQAKKFYWRKSTYKWPGWKRVQQTQQFENPEYSPRRTFRMEMNSDYTKRSPSPMFAIDDEDDFTDDASIASSYFQRNNNDLFDSNRRASLQPLKSLGIMTGENIKKKPSSTTVQNTFIQRSLSDGGVGDSIHDYSTLREVILSRKKHCDLELEKILNQLESCVSNRLQDDQKPLGLGLDRCISSLTEYIYKILYMDPYNIVTPGLASSLSKEIHGIQKELDSFDPIYSRFAVKVLLSFSEITRIIDQFEEDAKMMNCTGDLLHFPAFNENSAIEMNSNLLYSFRQDPSMLENKQERNLYRPFFMSTNQDGLVQDQWTLHELKTVSEEGMSLVIVLKISSKQEILFVSPSAELVFGYSVDSMIQNNELLFVNGDVYHMIMSACDKLNKESVPILLISFKGKRMDDRGLLMEGQGIKAVDFDGTIWLFKPIALVGSLWKSFDHPFSPSEGYNTSDSVRDSPSEPISLNMMGESNESLNVDLVLCHICERTIPALIFENHNHLCANVHRAELDLLAAQDAMNNIIIQLQKQTEFLNEEMVLETNELEVDPKIAQEQKLYINCLFKLSTLCHKLNEEIRNILHLVENEIKYAKDRSLNMPSKDSSKELGSIGLLDSLMEIPSSEFYPGKDLAFVSLSTVPEELLSISEALWTLAEQYDLVKCGIKEKISSSREATQVYLEAYLQEENLKIEIGIRTGVLNSSLSPFADATSPAVDVVDVLDIVKDSINQLDLQDSSQSINDLKNNSINNSSNTGTEKKDPLSFSQRKPQESISYESRDSLNLSTEFSKNELSKTFLDKSLGGDSNVKPKRRTMRQSRIVVNTKKILDVDNTTFESPELSDIPVSPLLGSFASSSMSRTSSFLRKPASIKDYEIVKPISKGAFGSVYLAKKRVTGDYYAIKVLKKADMIAKNQVSNIKAERMILTQLDSPYVVKLYYSFASKNHLYLVMEYLNGGDCASLLKAMGCLDENWARQYISEMVLGLEFLHSKGIVHRDLKPDNLLIDCNGHLRITDFGLSRMGFIGRRVDSKSRKQNVNESYGSTSASTTMPSTQPSTPLPNTLSNTMPNTTNTTSELATSFGSSISHFNFPKSHHRKNSSASIISIKSVFDEEEENRFLGTPDYLSPECILGIIRDVCVDWWAVGVILYEFLFGIPPFNAPTPQEIFENILARRIDWHEDIELEPDSRDLMDSLMAMDPSTRLGTVSAENVKQHSWFKSIVWTDLCFQEAKFIPNPKEIEDTEYFDTRGATSQKFDEEDDEEDFRNKSESSVDKLSSVLETNTTEESPQVATPSDINFGEFMYKNLPLLEQENQKLVKKLHSGFTGADIQKSKSLLKLRQMASSEISLMSLRRSNKVLAPSESDSESPSSSTHSVRRKRQSSAPLRLKSTGPKAALSPLATFALNKNANNLYEQKPFKLDILIADTNPVAAKILQAFLTKLGCRCITVFNGSDALAVSMFDINFDVILLDVKMPDFDGASISKMIRNSNQINHTTPLIGMTMQETSFELSKHFDDVLMKPISFELLKQILLAIRSDPFSPRGVSF